MRKRFEYFKNKPCTICTVEINFRFKEQQMMDYFMGIVENIDDDGIWIIHPITKCRSFIFAEHIVSIAEEQVLYDNNPEDAKIIQEYRQEKPLTSSKTQITEHSLKKEPFINPAALAEMAKKAKAFNEEKK